MFGLEDEKKKMEDEKKPQIPTLWIKTSRVSKAGFRYLFSMSVSLISFSSQATSLSSNWSIDTPAFSLFEAGFAWLLLFTWEPLVQWTKVAHATSFRVRIVHEDERFDRKLGPSFDFTVEGKQI